MPTQDPPVLDSTFEDKLDELISAVTPNVPGFVSDAYDPTDTYAVGEYAIHENILYKCTTAISTPEAWNSTHWTPTNCANELSQLKSSLDDLQSVVTIGSDADFINVLNSMSLYEVKPVFFMSTFIQPWFTTSYQNYGGYMVKHTSTIADAFGIDANVGYAIIFRGTKSGTPATLNVTKQKKVVFTAI